jgi:hypothetical protein
MIGWDADMPLNFYGVAEDERATGTGDPTALPFSFAQPPGYFAIDLANSETIVASFLETFKTEPGLTDRDRGLLIDGVEALDAQLNAVKDAGGVYFAHGMHPDPRLGVSESYLAAYVRDVAIGNPRSVLVGFAEAAAGEPGIKAVSRQDFSSGSAVIAEYERVLAAVSTERMPATERVTMHQLRAAFAFPEGNRLAIIELTTRHTNLWSDYRNVLLATADTVSFEPLQEQEEEASTDATGPETVRDRMSRLLG